MTTADTQETQSKKPTQGTLNGGLVGNGTFSGRIVSFVTRPYVAASGIGMAFGLAAMWLGAHPDQFATVQEAVKQAPQFVQELVKPWVHSPQMTSSWGKLAAVVAFAGGLKAKLATDSVILSSARASVKNEEDDDRMCSLVLEKRPADSFLPALDRSFAKGLKTHTPNLLFSSMFAATVLLPMNPVVALVFTAPTMSSFFALTKMASRVLRGERRGNVKGAWRFALARPEA